MPRDPATRVATPASGKGGVFCTGPTHQLYAAVGVEVKRVHEWGGGSKRTTGRNLRAGFIISYIPPNLRNVYWA